MTDKDTGGPAFPRPFSVDDVDPDISYPAHTGMTLRDYFAAKAMSSYIARPNLPISVTDEQLAFASYDMADAMLKAREQ